MNALIILISSLLFLMSLTFFVWSRNQLRSFQQEIQSKIQNNHVSSELTAINAGSIGMGERFLKLEKQLQELSVRLDEMSNEVQSNSPYSYAIGLAQKGESAEGIAELCHISQTEAQLLVMMHQQNQAA